jgi:hypothetical protein
VLYDPSQEDSTFIAQVRWSSLFWRVMDWSLLMLVLFHAFLGDTAVFVGTEENAALVSASGEISSVAIHGGGILCAASDGERPAARSRRRLRPSPRACPRTRESRTPLARIARPTH